MNAPTDTFIQKAAQYVAASGGSPMEVAATVAAGIASVAVVSLGLAIAGAWIHHRRARR